jgi:hypothetical protein
MVAVYTPELKGRARMEVPILHLSTLCHDSTIMREMGRNWRYWGYGAAALLAALWFSRSVGPGVLIALSAIVTAYFMFQAPLWCGAPTRGQQLCRNNAHGMLLGCHLRQHKWQKLKLAIVPRQWGRLNAGLWNDPRTALASFGAVLGIISTLVSTTIALVAVAGN